MRYFIALEIPEESKKELDIVQEKLQEIIPGIRATDNKKLHLTVAFIGEQPGEMKDDFAQIIKNATFEIPPFEITPAFIDGFPNLHRAHILWVGPKGDIDKLMILRERIKDGLYNLGLDTDDRRYVPHIALAKINGNFHLQEDQEFKLQKLIEEDFTPIKITSIKLFESIPEDGFHRHNTLAEIPLKVTSGPEVSANFSDNP